MSETTPKPKKIIVEADGAYRVEGGIPLVRKIQGIDYYKTLFEFVYGDTVVTEMRMQFALAQFVRSIQSFDSKFDAGFAQTLNLNAPFPNFTMQENMGKMSQMQAKTLTISQLAARLGVSRQTVYNMLIAGRLPVEPIPGLRPRRWLHVQRLHQRR